MTIRGAVGALCCAVLLAGCSSEAEPRTLPPVPSSSPSPVVLPVPPEATPKTAQGAAAFARYYFGQVVNQAYDNLDPAQVQRLSTGECGSCQNVVKDVERLKDAGLRVEGSRFKIKFAEAAPANADGSIIVDLQFSSDPYVEKNDAGEVVREEPPQIDQDAQVKLVRLNGSWAVEAIRTVEA